MLAADVWLRSAKRSGGTMKILLIVVAIIAVAVFVFFMGGQPPLRGAGQLAASDQTVIVSRARPPLTFAPAADMQLKSLGNRTLRPKTRHSVDGDARIWFAVYGNGTGTLVTAVADTEGTWEWEAAHHPAFPAIRAQQYAYKGETLYESLMQLDGASDPFCTDHAACLAYRAKLLLNFRKTQVIMEYHEPVPEAQVRDIAFDGAALNAFQQRARKACEILMTDKAWLEANIKGFKKLDGAEDCYSRTRLSRWGGEVEREGRP